MRSERTKRHNLHNGVIGLFHSFRMRIRYIRTHSVERMKVISSLLFDGNSWYR